MTDDELNQRFAQLADSVSRVADASTTGIQRLESAHLRAMEEIGMVASVLRQSIERDNIRIDRLAFQVEHLAESTDRLEMLMENFIRSQRPPENGGSQT